MNFGALSTVKEVKFERKTNTKWNQASLKENSLKVADGQIDGCMDDTMFLQLDSSEHKLDYR